MKPVLPERPPVQQRSPERVHVVMLVAGQEIANRFRLTKRLGGDDKAPVWLAAARDGSPSVVLKFQSHGFSGAVATSTTGEPAHPGIARAVEQLHDGEYDIQLFAVAARGELGASRGRACAVWLPQVREVAAALAYLHARGLVHGDVKASNVLVDGDGHALLADLDALRPVGAQRLASESYSPFTASPQQRAGAPAQLADDIYSFGALLYELLCAQPPGYLRNSGSVGTPVPSVPELLPVQPAPQQLVALTLQCLAPEVADRPPSMEQIAEQLTALAPEPLDARGNVPILTPPSAAADVIQPRWQRGELQEQPDSRQLRRQGFRQGLLVAAAVALAAFAVLLFVWPTRSPEPQPLKAPPPRVAPAADDVSPDLQALAKDKTEAESRRDDLAPRVAAMADADAGSWNPEALRASQAALAEIDALMQRREYQGARARFDALAGLVRTLEAGRKPALAAALQRGQTALQQNSSSLATDAFAQALKIDADNRDAQRGARRAASLDAVLAETARASVLEQSGKLGEAAAAYRHVLTLDADATAAQSGLARLQSQLATDQFGQALARGYAALSAGNAAAARAAFDAARAQRPSDPEVARALQQLAVTEQGSQLSAALSNAQQAEGSEQWLDATKYYQQALALDGTLVDARRALANATSRAQLDRELQSLIAQPERAYSSVVHDAGVASMQRAQAVNSPGPVLQRQMQAVAALLQKAEQPVNVALRSDGLTSITVYRIGELGTFSERALQLKPGRYVVAGTRTGYRDVRRELNVLPGQEQMPLTVQCTEPL